MDRRHPVLTDPTSDGRASNLQRYYAARASEYDEIYAKPERQLDLRALESFVASQFAGRHVLEIACGTGYWTQFIGTTAAHVTAIDAAPETLDIARARLPAKRTQLLVADAYALPETLGQFDAAFAGFWLSHVPKSRLMHFIAGLHERLVPGARVVFLDNRFVAGSSQAVVSRDAEGNSYQDRRLRDGSVHRVLKNFLDADDLRPLLRDVAEKFDFGALQYFWTLRYDLVNR